VIEASELEPDRPIPSETAIQQEFGVARATARHAVELLREWSLVVTVPGMGTYARKRSNAKPHNSGTAVVDRYGGVSSA
jgi:GntR family transcriptional regulator